MINYLRHHLPYSLTVLQPLKGSIIYLWICAEAGIVVTVVALAILSINFGGVAPEEAVNGGLYLFSCKVKNQ